MQKTFFFRFDIENQTCAYFHHHIHNERFTILVYSEFQINRSKCFSEVHPISVTFYYISDNNMIKIFASYVFLQFDNDHNIEILRELMFWAFISFKIE